MKIVEQNPSPSESINECIDPCFPAAAFYRRLPLSEPQTLRESSARRKLFPYSERHLHCVWQDPTLRPPQLRTRSGEPGIVENPGIWNQEAGPDFLGAVLRIGSDRRRIAGDVEIHVHPADWQAHGHANDPRYRNVRFHVTYFPGADTDLQRVPGAEQIVLKDSLTSNPGFSFDAIDVTAYPYAARADLPPCSLVLAKYSFAEKLEVLRAAGEERLRRKSERFHQFMHEEGSEQALYTELMAALGYKHNKTGFRQLANQLPVTELREQSQCRTRTAYALLAGLAGLLPSQPKANWSTDTQRWMRSLWDQWWRFRERYAQRGPAPTWQLAGVRPANHPARRLMGAALLFCGSQPVGRHVRDLARRYPDDWADRWIQHVTSLQDPYLSIRASLTGAPQQRPLALIGPTRAAAMVTNVLIPFLAATDGMQGVVNRTVDRLPPEADNGIVKQTAFYLFGRDASPTLYKSAVARQGLIQIFHDFCVNDRSRCSACQFPHALQTYIRRNSNQ